MSIDVRPLRPDDAPAAAALAHAVFAAQDEAEGETPPAYTDQVQARGERRVAHLQRTDPDGSWAAVDGDRLVGVGLASVRGPLWFLSLLVVAGGLQGTGVGGRLLEAVLATSRDCPAGLICSSDDPRALRRYALAGFDLLPGYRGKGTVDRSRLPAVDGVREGSWDDDRERIDALARQVRGAPLGPDVEALAAGSARLLVADSPQGQGYAVADRGSVHPVAATTPEAARALLVTGLADVEGEATVEFVTAQQQWAVRVMLELRLSFRPNESLAVRGFAPATPYLPDGAYG